MNQPPAAASSGMDPKLAGLLAYVIPPLTGIVFLLIEKSNRVVRWHAAQSIVFGVAWILLWIVLSVFLMIIGQVVPFLGAILGLLIWLGVGLGGLVLWVICLIKGYSGTEWRMPFLAGYAEKIVGNKSFA